MPHRFATRFRQYTRGILSSYHKYKGFQVGFSHCHDRWVASVLIPYIIFITFTWNSLSNCVINDNRVFWDGNKTLNCIRKHTGVFFLLCFTRIVYLYDSTNNLIVRNETKIWTIVYACGSVFGHSPNLRNLADNNRFIVGLREHATILN